MSWRYSRFARCGKSTVIFELIKWYNLNILLDLKGPTAVLNSLFKNVALSPSV